MHSVFFNFFVYCCLFCHVCDYLCDSSLKPNLNWILAMVDWWAICLKYILCPLVKVDSNKYAAVETKIEHFTCCSRWPDSPCSLVVPASLDRNKECQVLPSYVFREWCRHVSFGPNWSVEALRVQLNNLWWVMWQGIDYVFADNLALPHHWFFSG